MEEKKIKKIVWTSIILLVILLISIIAYTILKNQKVEKQLQKNGYEKTEEKIYKKETKTDTSYIIYTYNINEKAFTKTEEKKEEETKESITITNKNNVTKIDYTYKDLNGCFLIQDGTVRNKKYECNVIKRNKKSCNIKCEVMLKYINDFQKELKKLE